MLHKDFILADEDLLYCRAKYNNLINSITDYYYTVKMLNGDVVSTYHSPNCISVTGYSVNDYKDDPDLWFKMIHLADRKIVWEQIDNLFKGRPTKPIEHRIYHKEGGIIWIKHKLVPLNDENGNLIEYDGLIENITERKETEEALKLSEFKYRKIFKHTQDVYYRADNEGTLVDVSPSVRRYSEYSHSELIGKNIEQLYADPADRIELLKHVMENGAITDYEIALKSKKGKKIITSVNSHLIFDSQGKVIGIEGSLRDITDRKETEEKLKRLNQAVEQSPASIVITDVEGIIEYVNPRFTILTGYNPEDVIGKKSRILKSEKSNPGEFKKLWMLITQGNPWRGEFYNRKKNGELFWESVLISPIISKEGEVVNFLIIGEDISEKKKYISELIEAKENAEKSDKLKSQFLAQMSHEIRTPVNSIINFAQILMEESTEYNVAPKTCYNAIDISCKRIIRTIDMILRMSEIQTGNYKPSFKMINLCKEVINDVYNEFKPIADKKMLGFTFTSSKEDVYLLGDLDSIKNIFINLVDNAITFTPQGKIEINLFFNSCGNPCISVSDTGIGIHQDFIPYLFKPFRQEEQGYTRRYDGNGLGLALVKNYCDVNSADIHVESIKGKGSVFTVKFSQSQEK